MDSAHSDDIVQLLSADEIHRMVARIAHQIIERTALDAPEADSVILLGIPSGGVPFANRLATKIEEFSSQKVEVGALDITLYRDDLRATPHRALRPTKIPQSGIDSAIVILVDDVLFSGRSIRAALDALQDIGRPKMVQLAVLIDRGHRQLPIRADYVGKNIPTAASEEVNVYFSELDNQDSVILRRK